MHNALGKSQSLMVYCSINYKSIQTTSLDDIVLSVLFLIATDTDHSLAFIMHLLKFTSNTTGLNSCQKYTNKLIAQTKRNGNTTWSSLNKHFVRIITYYYVEIFPAYSLGNSLQWYLGNTFMIFEFHECWVENQSNLFMIIAMLDGCHAYMSHFYKQLSFYVMVFIFGIMTSLRTYWNNCSE